MKIGSLEVEGNVFLAPMAGITDPPFRLMVQRFGVSALWTEMMSSHALAVGRRSMSTAGLANHTVPTIFQIFGKDPSIMAEAAAIVEDLGASAVDLNMGCPVKKVVRKGAGAALMKDLPLAARIVAAVRKSVSIPVSVKIRAGWDDRTKNAPEMAAMIEREGADVVAVHCRTRTRGHSGPPNLDILTEVKDEVSIPVIGNGGISGGQSALSMIRATGCDGVMIGRAALGRPWLPGRILALLSGIEVGHEPSLTFFDLIRDHFREQLELRDVFSAVRRMRKHLIWYSRGFPGAAGFRSKVLGMEDPDQIMKSVGGFFGKAVIS